MIEPEKNGILVLSTYLSNKPMITDSSGALISDFEFSYDDETEVIGSCSVIWQNENYLFGGWSDNKIRQIAKIDKCRLTRIGELDFEHYRAGCALVKNVKILLCFSSHWPWVDMNKCRSLPSPTGAFESIPPSKFKHGRTKIAASDSKLFFSKHKIIP